MVELMVELMPKVVKPLTELEVKNLKPRVMPDGTTFPKCLRRSLVLHWMMSIRTKQSLRS